VTHDVCAAADVARGQMVPARAGDTPIVLIRMRDGRLHALLDRCIHQGGPLSRGRLQTAVGADAPGSYREEEGRAIVKCPWHGFEFEVETGCSLFDPRRRVARVDVREEGGRVLVER
jgi:nitrite reductase/ring-hydroxylating ferredoxin subunit